MDSRDRRESCRVYRRRCRRVVARKGIEMIEETYEERLLTMMRTMRTMLAYSWILQMVTVALLLFILLSGK